jgi:hypothetical protein
MVDIADKAEAWRRCACRHNGCDEHERSMMTRRLQESLHDARESSQPTRHKLAFK